MELNLQYGAFPMIIWSGFRMRKLTTFRKMHPTLMSEENEIRRKGLRLKMGTFIHATNNDLTDM